MARRIALHSSELHFIHPATEEKMDFILPLPDALAKLV